MSTDDLYGVLGVSRDSAQGEIKKAYKRLVMRYHPDRNQSPDAEGKFKQIQQAYSVLSNPQKKEMYDRFGTVDANDFQGGFGGGGSFTDIFDDIFSDMAGFAGQGRQQAQFSQRGRDLRIDISLGLRDAVDGCQRTVSINAMESCGDCDGSGAAPGTRRARCLACGGSGRTRRQISIMSIQETCSECAGTGETIKDPCSTCHGEGRIRNRKRKEIDIPPGVDTGDTLRLPGAGEAGRHGTQPGSLLVHINVEPHPIFTRKGDDLHCEMPISFAEAALGGEARIPTLEGSSKKVKIPKGLQSRGRLKIRGQGVKGVRSSIRGDLYCTVVVETPQNLDAEQSKLLAEFGETLKKNPQKHSPESSGWLAKVKSFFS